MIRMEKIIMKKTTVIALALILAALLCACQPAGKIDDTSADTTIPVTSPDGFEDVTAPPVTDTTAPEAEKDTTAADTTAEDTTKDSTVSDSEEALTIAKNWLGDTDPDIGYKYAFSYDGMMTDGGKEYYKIRVSWYIEEQERYSLCGYLLVDENGSVSKYSW